MRIKKLVVGQIRDPSEGCMYRCHVGPNRDGHSAEGEKEISHTFEQYIPCGYVIAPLKRCSGPSSIQRLESIDGEVVAQQLRLGLD